MEETVNTSRARRLRWEPIRDALPFALTVASAGVFAFLSGGYVLTRSSPVAIVYLLLTAAWLWLLRRRSRPPLLHLAALAVLGAFVAWAALSVLWSFGPDLTWVAFDLAAFYFVVVAVLVVSPARGPQLQVAGYGFLVVAVAVAVYAFLGKVMPDVVTHAHTYARLDSPIGYWNVLALFMILGLVVALALAGDRAAHPAWRLLAVGGAVPLCFTFFFTFSRGGYVSTVVALGVYFALTRTRLASFAGLVAVVAPVAAALYHVRGLGTLFDATTNAALRTAQGHTLLRWSLLALVAAVVLQALVMLTQGAVAWPRSARLAAGAIVVAVLLIGFVGGSWRFVEARGGASWVKHRVHALVTDSDQSSTANGAGRLASVNTGRPPLWREAIRQSRTARLRGTGAGTFVFTHYRFRTTPGIVKHAHSEWFNVLSELGVVGLALFVLAMVLLVASAIGNPFSRRAEAGQPLLVALQAGILAFVVHLSWDWDWDMAAAGVVLFLFIGVCASYLATRSADSAAAAVAEQDDDEGPASSRRAVAWPARTIATAALALLAVSWLVPYLATRAEDAGVAAAGENKTQLALRDVRRAEALDPLAVDPLITESLVLQQQGRSREALAILQKAASLQPANYDVYYQLGLLQLKVFGRRQAAEAAFRRALRLNPEDAATLYELRSLGGS